MNLSENEQVIINELRNLAPYEKIEITADKNGKPDWYLVHRSSKVVLTTVTQYTK